jgi:hypothetical protein
MFGYAPVWKNNSDQPATNKIFCGCSVAGFIKLDVAIWIGKKIGSELLARKNNSDHTIK